MKRIAAKIIDQRQGSNLEAGVRLQVAEFTVEDVFGSVEPIPETSADFDREIEDAMETETRRLRPQE
jgi:hypothetical protein